MFALFHNNMSMTEGKYIHFSNNAYMCVYLACYTYQCDSFVLNVEICFYNLCWHLIVREA